jgi:hypothetical protein
VSHACKKDLDRLLFSRRGFVVVDSLAGRPDLDGRILISFLTIVASSIVLAFVSLTIRRFLSRDRRRSASHQNNVSGRLFQKRVNYQATGPIAEFVIVLTTIAFIVTIFWILLSWHKGP